MQFKKTKIVCTIGPACWSEAKLERLAKAGMNVARLNFSHGKREEFEFMVERVRKISEKLEKPIGLLQDLQGPRIRIGDLENPINLKKGEKVILDCKNKVQVEGKIPLTYQGLCKDVKEGDSILIADGVIELIVSKVKNSEIECRVKIGGELLSHKGINVPGASLGVSTITKKDKEDLKFGISQGVDFVALSFVRSKKDIADLRKLIKEYGGKNQKIIAKIEAREALKNLDEIVFSVDGIMVARGDLGIEVGAEEVPIIQKDLIRKCLDQGKFVIVATQMLDSMIENARPTRAEVSDVANAVIDHTDAVMLSGETSIGKYPVETVSMMAKIATETEESSYDDMPCDFLKVHGDSKSSAVARAACEVASDVKARAIVVGTVSGEIARAVSRCRPEDQIIVAITNSRRVYNQLSLSWGVFPIFKKWTKGIEKLVKGSESLLKEKGWVRKGDDIVVVGGYHDKEEVSDSVKVLKVD